MSDHVAAAGYLIETVGVLIIVIGALAPWVMFIVRVRSLGVETAYHDVRRFLGRAILLGLEFLIAGDIIRTVVVSPSLNSSR